MMRQYNITPEMIRLLLAT